MSYVQTKAVNAELEFKLEDLMNEHGLRLVLSSLARVCEEVCNQSRDPQVSVKWAKAAKRIDRCLSFDIDDVS